MSVRNTPLPLGEANLKLVIALKKQDMPIGEEHCGYVGC
jgi:hypothetical protein